MNTLKFHEGRLENLDDLTGYRNFTENILPLPEAAINAAVRDAVYLPLPISAAQQSSTSRTVSTGRELRPKHRTNTSGAIVSRGEGSPTSSDTAGEGRHFSSLGPRAYKDWHPFLMPDEPRRIDMVKLMAEIRRLEEVCRRRNQGVDPRLISNREWIGCPLPSSAWRVDNVQDWTEEMAIDTTPDHGERTEQATTPTALAPIPTPAERYPQVYTETHGPADPLPSFDSFLQRTFEGLPPSKEQSRSGLPSLVDGAPRGPSGSAAGSWFPGPLKSRHELDATRGVRV